MPVLHPHTRDLEIDQLGNVTRVLFTSTQIMESELTEEIGGQLFDLLKQGKCRILLDFRNLERVSSGLVAKIITLHKRVVAQSGRLAICNVNPAIHDVFEMLRLPKFLNIYGREAEALQSF